MENNNDLLKNLWLADYKEIPVSPREFFNSEYYFGDSAGKLYPKWLDELEEVLDPQNKIYEWCITGAIGTGKTTIACASLLYKLYWLLCLKTPHEFFNLMAVQPISFILFSIYKYKAHDVVFEKFRNMINSSPYFRNAIKGRFRRNIYDYYQKREEAEIKLPSSIRVIVGARGEHALSEDIMGGILDEVNFRPIGVSSDFKYLNSALGIYEAVSRRMKSRFKSAMIFPGLLCLVSSKKSETDFLEEYIKKVGNDSNVKISSYSLWDVKDGYSKKKFYVLLGGSAEMSRIVPENEAKRLAETGANLISIPEDFKKDFETDIVSALRDVAGVAVTSYKHYLRDTDILEDVMDVERADIVNGYNIGTMFRTKIVKIGLKSTKEIKDYINWDKLVLGGAPKFYRKAERVISVDLSKSGDATGISMGCISRVDCKNEEINGKRVRIKLPFIWIDFNIRIKNFEKDEIDFDKIVMFIRLLRDIYGFKIRCVTYDGFQSVHSLQSLAKAGFNVKTYSIDRSSSPYDELYELMRSKRISIPANDFLVWELKNLVALEKPNGMVKYDHTAVSSKDVADSLAGVCGMLLELWNANEIIVGSYVEEVKIWKEFLKPIENPDFEESYEWVISDYTKGVH